MFHNQALASCPDTPVADTTADMGRRPPDLTIHDRLSSTRGPLTRRQKLRAIGISLRQHAKWQNLRKNLLPAHGRVAWRGGVVAPPPSPPVTAQDAKLPLIGGAACGDAAWEEPRLKPCACCDWEDVVPSAPGPARGWRRRFRDWASAVKHKMDRAVACIFGKGHRRRREQAKPRREPPYQPQLGTQDFQEVKTWDSLTTLTK